MNAVTKTIIKAVVLQITGTILLGSAFYALFFSIAETAEFFKALWLQLFFGFLSMYFAGRWIGNSFKPTFKFKVWHGIFIIFGLLIIAIITGVLATLFIPNWDSIESIQGIVSVVLIFLTFGGLPTLIVGIWLGYALRKNSISEN